MGIFAVGEVVVLSFPFSNLSYKKNRPALVVGKSDFGNIIVAQISSKLTHGASGTPITNADFSDSDPLQKKSYIRCNKLFTADPELATKSLGFITAEKRAEVHSEIVKTFEGLVG